MDSNRGYLMLEATALPTELQPLPKYFNELSSTNWWSLRFCIQTEISSLLF